jgi:hypothetical protein
VKSEALKIAQLQCRTQLESQMLGIVTDPLWSSILGFCAVHKLQKEDYIGPLAADALYVGIIAVNSARSPGLQDLAGKGIDVAGMAGAAGVGLLAGKAAGGAAAGAAAGGVAKASTLATVARVAGPAALTIAGVTAVDKAMLATKPNKYKRAWTKIPLWKRIIPGVAEKEYLKNVKKIDRGEL